MSVEKVESATGASRLGSRRWAFCRYNDLKMKNERKGSTMNMKKKMFWMLLLAAMAARADLVEETKAEPVLAGSIVVAPFSEVTAKVTTLGAMINNPLVPMLLCSSMQQSLSEAHGRFSAERPIAWMAYLQTPAWNVVATNDDVVAQGDLYDLVLVYPSVDKAARMKLNNPGSTQAADGTIHLPAGENRAQEQYVKFTADGRHCAFAPSSTLAAQALADFEKLGQGKLAGSKVERPLVRISIPEKGLAAIESLQDSMKAQVEARAKAVGKEKKADMSVWDTLQKWGLSRQNRQSDVLRRFKEIEMSIDLNAKGLEFSGRILPKTENAAMAVSGARLPTGALDKVPSSAAFFMAANLLFQTGLKSEAEFRAELKDVEELMAELVACVEKDEATKDYGPFAKDLQGAVVELLQSAQYPAVGDWAAGALGFDKDLHPYLSSYGESVHAAANWTMGDKWMTRVLAAFEKQFPKSGILAKRAAGAYTIDWAALIDFAGAQAGIKADDEEAKDLAEAKKTVSRVLGATKTDLTTVVDGTTERQLVAQPGFTLPVSNQPTGEARLLAALPEIATDRPASAAYLTPYAFARGTLLPLMAKFAKSENAQQYQTMIAAMTEPEANSAIAAAGWCDANGGCRWLLRVTAHELKNFGAAFNAFTAASMSSALGADKDE